MTFFNLIESNPSELEKSLNFLKKKKATGNKK
jgi:hypothetical protein